MARRARNPTRSNTAPTPSRCTRTHVASGTRVALVDDLLATGGTAGAAIKLLQGLGAEVVAAAFVIELAFLKGRAQLGDVLCDVLLTYE